MTNVQHTQVDEKDLADGKTNEETEDWAFKKVYGDKTWNFKERLVYTANDHLKLTHVPDIFFVNVRSHRLVKTVIETSVVG